MLVELVNRLLELSVPTLTDRYGATYSDRSLRLVPPPQPEPIRLGTLTGLVEAIRARVDDLDPAQWLLVVQTCRLVHLVSRRAGPTGARAVLVTAELEDGQSFPFGQFLDRETFVIGLQSKFLPGDALASVLQLASALEASTVAVAEDDGISQKTTVRQGAVLKQQVSVKGRVSLRPYRTFREVTQPASEFVFRLRSTDGALPDCALFEGDGGTWKLDAMLTIKAWLEAQTLGVPVVA